MDQAPLTFQTVARTRINLDIALLRTFVAVIELGGVARAAQQVGRSQPAVSLQLKRLEDVFGAALFQKNGRGLVLTESGDVLLGYARRLLDLNDETVTAVTALPLSGSIRLGISQDFAEGWLTKVLARFARAHPSVIVEVKADRNAVLFELLARQQLDFALTFGEGHSGGAIELGRVPLVWIGSRDVPLQDGERIPLVMFEPPCEFRRVGIEALETAGVPWRLAFSSPSLTSQWSAVEAGLGISIRTPIGLRPSLMILEEREGLPSLPSINLLLMHRPGGKQEAPVRKLQEILIATIREKLQADIGLA